MRILRDYCGDTNIPLTSSGMLQGSTMPLITGQKQPHLEHRKWLSKPSFKEVLAKYQVRKYSTRISYDPSRQSGSNR
jgi:hypothetical protein